MQLRFEGNQVPWFGGIWNDSVYRAYVDVRDESGVRAHDSADSFTDAVVSLDAGTYYVRVNARLNGTTVYQLQYAQTRSGDAGGRTFATATNLGEISGTPISIAGSVHDNSFDVAMANAYYRFTLSAASTVRVVGTSGDGSVRESIQPVTTTDLPYRYWGGGYGTFLRLGAGTYYIKIEGTDYHAIPMSCCSFARPTPRRAPV